MPLLYWLHTETIYDGNNCSMLHIYPGTRITSRCCSLLPGNELHTPNVYWMRVINVPINCLNILFLFLSQIYLHYIYYFMAKCGTWLSRTIQQYENTPAVKHLPCRAFHNPLTKMTSFCEVTWRHAMTPHDTTWAH